MNSNLPYKINWINLDYLGFPDSVAVGSLPGTRHRFIIRDLNVDGDVLLRAGIKNAFILNDDAELQRFGVRHLREWLEDKDINVRQYACELGMFPSVDIIMKIIQEIFQAMENGQKCIIISREGFGRSCVVAGALLLHTNDNLLHDEVYDMLKRQIGPRAVQTVKQYNFLVDFRELRDTHQLQELEDTHGENVRCISR